MYEASPVGGGDAEVSRERRDAKTLVSDHRDRCKLVSNWKLVVVNWLVNTSPLPSTVHDTSAAILYW